MTNHEALFHMQSGVDDDTQEEVETKGEINDSDATQSDSGSHKSQDSVD